MTNTPTVDTRPLKSVLVDMASRYGMEPQAFEATLRKTVFPENGSREEFSAFLLVAKEYNLNPVTKEIYAFPKQGGGIQPIVSIDGWMQLINSHKEFDGMEFADTFDEAGNMVSITCKMYRKDRTHPIEVTEYMAECARSSEPWKKWPRRMLRHKSAIQASRYAFGFSGIVDPDEAERISTASQQKPAGVVIDGDMEAGKPNRLERIVNQTQPANFIRPQAEEAVAQPPQASHPAMDDGEIPFND